MYAFLGWVQFLASCAVIVIAGVLSYDRWRGRGPARAHRLRKETLKQQGVREEEVDRTHRVAPDEAARRNLEFLSVPDVSAGQVITKVPCLDPLKERDFIADRVIVTTLRVIAYTRQGADPLEMIELDGGYLLISCGGRQALLKHYNLMATQEEYLQNQRKDAIERDDGTIEDFCGHRWTVRGAYGTNVTRKSGERACSVIQVLTTHTGERFRSVLQPGLFDLKEHDYYDLRALREDGQQYLYAFYAGGSWRCFIGRVLDADEARHIMEVMTTE